MSLLLLLYGIETEEAAPAPPVPPVIVTATGAVGGGLRKVVGRRPGVYTGIFAEWIERDDEEIITAMSEFLQ